MPNSTTQMRTKRPILLVEDHPSNALVTGEILNMLGYRCDTAATGDEALIKFACNPYALIMMDVQLPGIDGIEVTRRIRDIEKIMNFEPTPIIAVTSNATVDDKFFCLRAGMNDYLSKPFNAKDLERKISAILAPPPELSLKTA